MWLPCAPRLRGRLADLPLTAALALLTFLLACQELFDADTWWHLRAGRWILEHRAVPRTDPFTYGAPAQPWIDLHWLFQVTLALAYAAGGVAGIIVLAAAGATAAVLTGFGLRQREWPAALVAAAWVPAVLLTSTRFDPRPEIVTLIGLSAFFGILLRARQAPGWLWMLLPIEVVWVNCHGLFVLGPWLVLLFLLDRAVVRGERAPPWSRLLPPSLAVGLACLVNPYGVRGVLVPLELFPKLTEAGGPYKSYIGEFMSVRRFVATYWLPVPGHDIYLRLLVFLLVLLPLVFLVTALQRTWRSGRPAEEGIAAGPGAWAGALAGAVTLALAVAVGLPDAGTPAWRAALGWAVPWVLAGTGATLAVAVGRRSRRAAALALLGAGANAAWVVWLVGHLFAGTPNQAAAAVALGLAIPAAWLAFQAGTRPFGPVLAASFAALALLAVRNVSLFGLVSGAVLAAELGEWAATLGHARRPSPGRGEATPFGDAAIKTLSPWERAAEGRVRADAQVGVTHPEIAASGSAAALTRPSGTLSPWERGCGAVLVGVAVLCIMVMTGRFFALAEDCRRFGLRERPLYYAHDACRFAGQDGLPERALVFSLLQAGVYEFHNSPARQVFVDGRLEVVSRATFEAYVRIHDRLTNGDPRWDRMLERLGPRPLILVDHEDNAAAEATLLASPRWRCIYFDAVAAVFVAAGAARVREDVYPTLDFAAQRFGPRSEREKTARPLAGEPALATARALARIGAFVAHRPPPPWSLRIPLFLAAMDRARRAVAAAPAAAESWIVLGHAAMGIASDPAPHQDIDRLRPGWDPAVDLAWAQGAAAYRKAIERAPQDASLPDILATSLALRGMSLASEQAAAAETRQHRGALTWAAAERVAAAYLHLGQPAEARRTWRDAAGPPSEALRSARVADADLAAWDFAAAEAGYRRAVARDPDLADAWVGLALTALETGSAAVAREAARSALKTPAPIEARRRALLEGIEALCAPHAP
jgi:tetratricopeptide (TPR) repeat protein